MPTIDLSTIIKIALRAVMSAVGNPVLMVSSVGVVFVAVVAYVSNDFNAVMSWIPTVSGMDFGNSTPLFNLCAFCMDWHTLFLCFDFVVSVTAHFTVYFLAFSAFVISAVVIIIGFRTARQVIKDFI